MSAVVSVFFERMRPSHLVLATFVILLTGGLLDARFEGFWFQRSGAVLVALAVIFFGYDFRKNREYLEFLRNRMENEKQYAEEPLREARAIERLNNAMGLKTNNVQDAFLETRPAVFRADEDYRKQVRAVMRIRQTEILMLVIGTLVWAFGDLPSNVFRCGELICDS